MENVCSSCCSYPFVSGLVEIYENGRRCRRSLVLERNELSGRVKLDVRCPPVGRGKHQGSFDGNLVGFGSTANAVKMKVFQHSLS